MKKKNIILVTTTILIIIFFVFIVITKKDNYWTGFIYGFFYPLSWVSSKSGVIFPINEKDSIFYFGISSGVMTFTWFFLRSIIRIVLSILTTSLKNILKFLSTK